MELKWLEDFVTLAETSSFSRAAEARNVTQPAFSRRIKQLEAWLGTTLINRATVPAELTPEGRRFLPVAQDAIRNFYSVRESLQPSGEGRMLRLAALHTLTVTFLPDWLENRFANIRVSLIPDRGGIEANLAALIDGEADFFLTYAHGLVPFHLDWQRFDFLAVGTDRLIPVAAPEVRLRSGVHVPGAALFDRMQSQGAEVPHLSYGYSSFFGVALERLFAGRSGPRRRTVHENTISAGLKTLAMRGAGMCWLPESLIEQELRAGTLVRASASPDWDMELEIRLYRHIHAQNADTRRFWQAAQGPH